MDDGAHGAASVTTTRGWWTYLPWAATVFASCGLLWLASIGGPPPDQDATYFLGSAQSLARGDGLTNRLDALLMSQDPAGQARLVAYPPAFPLLLGLVGADNTAQAYVAMACLAITALVALTLLLDAAASKAGIFGRCAQAAAVLGFAGIFANAAFRPEPVIILLALAWVAGARGITSAVRRATLLGAFTGVAVHVQVPLALYGVLAWLAIESQDAPWPELARRTLRFGVAMFAGVVAGTLLHPYGTAVYVRSFLEFASSMLSMRHIESWTPYWVFGVRYPGLIFPIAAAVILAALRTRRTWRSLATPLVFFAAVTLATVLTVRNTWMMPSRWYEVAMYMPFVYLALLSWTAEILTRQPRRRTLLATAILAAIGVNAVGLLGRLVQGMAQQMAGTSMPSGRRALHAEVTHRGGLGVVGIEAPLGLLLEHPERACSVVTAGTLARTRSCSVAPRLLVTFEGRRRGEALQKSLTLRFDTAAQRAVSAGVWHLVCTFRGRDGRRPPAFFGALSGGWSFAVYERSAPSSARHVSTSWSGVRSSTTFASEVPRCGVS